MNTKFQHDITMQDDKILNTVCGIKYLRDSGDKNNLNIEIERLEYEACKLPSAYETFDICYVYLIFSQKCNLSCIYCFEKNLNHKVYTYNNSNSQVEYYINFISTVEKLYSKVCVILYGGEPLLNENYNSIERILDFIKNRKINLRIISNGMLLNQYLNLFVEYNCIQNITVSLDGNREIHDMRRKDFSGKGTYNQIINNIKLALSKTDIPIRIRINLDYDNIFFQNQLLDEVSEINNKNLIICYYRTTNNTDSYSDDKVLCLSKFAEILDSIYEKYKDKIKIECGVNTYNQIKNLLEYNYTVYPRLTFCEFGYIYLLNCDKYIYTCGETVNGEEFRLCHIDEFLKTPFQYKQPKQISILCDNNKELCYQCEVNTICGGGCKLARENKKTFCEKKEIIKTINEMYLRRKN